MCIWLCVKSSRTELADVKNTYCILEQSQPKSLRILVLIPIKLCLREKE